MSGKKNGYIILQLDPSVNDWKVIEARIEEKTREWNNLVLKGNQDSKRTARNNLALLGEIKQRLKEPTTRKKEADEARQVIKQNNQQRRMDFDTNLKIIASGNKRLTPEQVERWTREFKEVLSPDEVKERIDSFGIIVGEGDKSTTKNKERLEAAIMTDIRGQLEVISSTDLYDFLGLKPNTSLEKLVARADEIHKDEMEKTITSERDAKCKLAGHCRNVFSSEEKKQKYDNSLAVEAMHGLDRFIEVAGLNGVIQQGQMIEIIKKAREKGVETENAQDYIREYAEKRKITYLEDIPSGTLDLPLCGFCFTLAKSAKDKFCRNCRRPLVIKCRNCNADVPTQYDVCAECGTKVGDTLKAMELLEEAKKHWKENKDALETDTCIDRALYYWPNSPEVIEFRQEIERQKGKTKTELDKVKKHIRDMNFESAQSALDDFKRKYPGTDIGTMPKQIEDGLANARAVYQQAESLFIEGKYETAYSKYQESLSCCRDFSPAIKGASRCPPNPPQNAQARLVKDNSIALSWSISSSGPIQSVILRKTGTPPIGIKDKEATQVDVTNDKQWEDQNAPIGKSVYYAIYEKRGDLLSATGAVTNRIFVTAEVSEFNLVPGNMSVDGTLVPPPCDKVIVVYKKSTPPASLSDGDRVSLLGNRSFSLTGLVNGETYYFRAVCQYTDENDIPVNSQGVIQIAVPDEIPLPVLNLSFEKLQNGLKIKWPAIPRGNVHIYRSEIDPSVMPGEIASKDKLDNCGRLITTRVDSCSILDNDVPEGLSYYTPVTVIGMISVFGKTHDRIELPEVSNITVESLGSRLRLLWRWPENIDLVKVFWSYSDIIDIKNKPSKLIDSGSYRSGGGCFIEMDCDKPVVLTVHSIQSLNDQERLSSGVRVNFSPQRPPTQAVMTYSLRRALFHNKLTICVRCLEGSVSGIAFALVAAKYAMPKRINEDQIVCKFDNISLKKGDKMERSFEPPKNSRDLVLGLLPLAEYQSFIKMNHPRKEDRTL